MKLSSKALACGQSPMRKFHPYAVAAAAAGKKIYHLNIGQPDIHTPDALYDAIHNFRTPVLAYAASPGIPELIEAIRKYYENIGVGLDESDILITTGGSEALQIAANCLLDDGDEVIVPEPFYPNYHTFITTAGGVIHPLHTKPEEGYFYADRARIEACITPKTKAIMPVHMLGNPCDMDPIMEIAKKHNLYVIEDCCQAVGAAYHGKRVGTIGDMGAYSLNVFKTITTGDGGFVGTSSDELYERAFGFHDQGHKPCRMGVEVGNRSMVGMNMRMNELSGAVAVAQGRKLDGILDTLRAKKKELKGQLQGIDGLGFRKINDEKECATLLTLLFDTKELADKFCAVMGTAPIAKSGWHVYNNMEQILDKKTWTDNHPFHLSDRTYEKHMLPQTDDILDRAVNISIGVVDKGLGSGCGININSTEEEINATAKHIREVIAGL